MFGLFIRVGACTCTVLYCNMNIFVKNFFCRSPCSVGTIWAINKAFFFEVGGFDDGMDFWGGENIDLSLRVSMPFFFRKELQQSP